MRVPCLTATYLIPGMCSKYTMVSSIPIKADCLMLLLHEPLVPIYIKISSFIFKVPCSQVWQKTNKWMDTCTGWEHCTSACQSGLVDGRTDRLRTLCLCLPIWPGGQTHGQVENIVPLPANLAWWTDTRTGWEHSASACQSSLVDGHTDRLRTLCFCLPI